MKTFFLLFLFLVLAITQLYSQDTRTRAEKAIHELIDAYSLARET